MHHGGGRRATQKFHKNNTKSAETLPPSSCPVLLLSRCPRPRRRGRALLGLALLGPAATQPHSPTIANHCTRRQHNHYRRRSCCVWPAMSALGPDHERWQSLERMGRRGREAALAHRLAQHRCAQRGGLPGRCTPAGWVSRQPAAASLSVWRPHSRPHPTGSTVESSSRCASERRGRSIGKCTSVSATGSLSAAHGAPVPPSSPAPWVAALPRAPPRPPAGAAVSGETPPRAASRGVSGRAQMPVPVAPP